MTDHDKLIALLKQYSFTVGEEFTLASGQKSNTYVDVKKTALHKDAHHLLAKLLYESMINNFGTDISSVAGVVLGGCHLASIVAMYSILPLNVIFVRKNVKDHGTKNLIEKPSNFGDLTNGVVLLEDVTTTGNSAIEAAKIIEKSGLTVRGIISVVDRRPSKEAFLSSWKFVSLINFEDLQ